MFTSFGKSTQYCLTEQEYANKRVHGIANVVGIITLFVAIVFFIILVVKPEWIKKKSNIYKK